MLFLFFILIFNPFFHLLFFFNIFYFDQKMVAVNLNERRRSEQMEETDISTGEKKN